MIDEAIRPEQSLQATGSFDPIADEYSLSLVSGCLVVTFDFLTREQIEHIKSCLDCMLMTLEPESNEQR
jgi:hypothetical protein